MEAQFQKESKNIIQQIKKSANTKNVLIVFFLHQFRMKIPQSREFGECLNALLFLSGSREIVPQPGYIFVCLNVVRRCLPLFFTKLLALRNYSALR